MARIACATALVSLALLAGACASEGHAESAAAAAREACTEQQAPDMAACIATMTETIEAAREYQPPPPARPAAPARSQRSAPPRTTPQGGSPY